MNRLRLKLIFGCYKTILVLFWFLQNSSIDFAQDDTLIFQPVSSPILQQYDIRAISAEKNGKLWLYTGNGLVSYDGNDIHVYAHDDFDTTSLSGDNLSRGFIDVHGNLFIVITGETQVINGQIDYFNSVTGRIQRYKIKIDKEDSSGYNMPFPFYHICMANDSVILAGRSSMGFIRYNLITKKANGYSLLCSRNPKHNNVYSIHKDIKDGNLFWLATDDGIYSFNAKSNRLQRNFRCTDEKDSTDLDVDLRDLDIRSNDTIWFINHIRGLGCYDMKTGYYTIFPSVRKPENKEEKLFIEGFQYVRNGRYLVMTDYNPPCLFNINTREYIFNSKIGIQLPALYNNQVVADSIGNVWLVEYGKLFWAKQKGSKFLSVPVFDRFYHDQYTDIFKTVLWDEKRALFYVTFHMSDGIYVFNERMELMKTIPGPPYLNPSWGSVESYVVDIGLDKNERLWMCGDVVSIYDSSRQKMVPVESSYPKLKVLRQRFRNFVFRGAYLYALPGNSFSQYLYRINVDKFTCDSILLPDIPVHKKQPANQLGPLEMDSGGNNAYISNKSTVFQYNLLTGKTRNVIELTDTDKPFAFWSNFHWYNVDDDDNLWVSSLKKTWVFEPVNFRVIRTIERKKNTYFNQAYNIKGKSVMCYVNSTSYDLYDYKNQKQYKLSMNDGLISYLNWSTAFANNLLFVGGSNYFQYIPWSSVIKSFEDRKCYLSGIGIFNKPLDTDTIPQYLHSLKLRHDQNYISFTFSCLEFDEPEKMEYRYRLDGVNSDWIYVNYLNRTISYTNLVPGNYTFHAAVKNADGTWSKQEACLIVTIIPAWWQTTWFTILCALFVSAAILYIIRRRITIVRRQEQLKGKYEKEMLELEAKALRAQMNPHFIFNCMNSIKSLIQQNKQDKAVNYLTTFSKLIRTIFQNSDKREISLYDEIETCRLYTQLESMRFGDKFDCIFNIDKTLDLKSIVVPALIIQPFIENAIWHGIVPKGDEGVVTITVIKKDHEICCSIDDNGIGREISYRNKFKVEPSSHESKGVHLTQVRLDLDNLLNERRANVRIVDKKDENERPLGTTVVLYFEEY